MISLVSLAYMKLHVRSTEDQDADLESKLSIASRIVMNHIKKTEIPDEWTIDDGDPVYDSSIIETDESPSRLVRIPGDIQAATILVAAELFENRESSNSNPLSDTVIDLLRPFRDPTFA